MYCKKCGKEVSEDSVYCQYCGALIAIKDEILNTETAEENHIDTEKKQIIENNTANENQNVTQIKEKETEGKKTIEIILSLVGAILLLYAYTTYTNDTSKLWGYTYEAPFTTHETVVIFSGIIGLALVVANVLSLLLRANNIDPDKPIFKDDSKK